MAIRIGLSGWRYPPWRGAFQLPQREELHYPLRGFRSIEPNGSFRLLQTPGSCRQWHDATPIGKPERTPLILKVAILGVLRVPR